MGTTGAKEKSQNHKNGNPIKTTIEIASKQNPHIIIDKLLLDILFSYLSTVSLNKYAINIPKINGDNTLLT